MLHEPAKQVGDDPAGSYKVRLGNWMFLFYGLFYAGFVAINLISPLLMQRVVFAGLNLATVYGFGLILVALIQALIYDYLCRRQEHLLATKPPPPNARPAQAGPRSAPVRTEDAQSPTTKRPPQSKRSPQTGKRKGR